MKKNDVIKYLDRLAVHIAGALLPDAKDLHEYNYQEMALDACTLLSMYLKENKDEGK